MKVPRSCSCSSFSEAMLSWAGPRSWWLMPAIWRAHMCVNVYTTVSNFVQIPGSHVHSTQAGMWVPWSGGAKVPQPESEPLGSGPPNAGLRATGDSRLRRSSAGLCTPRLRSAGGKVLKVPREEGAGMAASFLAWEEG